MLFHDFPKVSILQNLKNSPGVGQAFQGWDEKWACFDSRDTRKAWIIEHPWRTCHWLSSEMCHSCHSCQTCVFDTFRLSCQTCTFRLTVNGSHALQCSVPQSSRLCQASWLPGLQDLKAMPGLMTSRTPGLKTLKAMPGLMTSRSQDPQGYAMPHDFQVSRPLGTPLGTPLETSVRLAHP